ncbi:MAG TPA: hypothetical protein DCS90_01205 [Ktedonobacter sp.]|jgi:formate dehydrogenase major subunit|nr:hypothetical protein [Ktedonobacter sp.]
MAVFATLFGRLAQRLSPGNVGETLHSHVGQVPNPVSERSQHLKPRIHDAKSFTCNMRSGRRSHQGYCRA